MKARKELLKEWSMISEMLSTASCMDKGAVTQDNTD